MSRLIRLAALTFSVIGLLALRGPAESADKVLQLLDWLPYGKHAPLYLGVEKGVFKAAGIDLHIQRGFGSSNTTKRIAAGEGDYGLADSGSLILGRAAGAKVKILGMFADKSLLVAYSLKSSGIRRIADLKGKTIGWDAGGTSITKLFPAVAETNGLKAGDWKTLILKPAVKNPSLLSGKVDAILTVHVIYPTLNAKAKEQGDELVPMLFRDYGLDVYSHAWFTREKIADSMSDRTRRYMKALTQSIAMMMKDPGGGMDIFLAKNPTISNRNAALGEWRISEDALVTATAKKHGLGYVDGAKMKKTIDIIDEYVKLKNPVSPGEMYTNEFLPGIKPSAKSM